MIINEEYIKSEGVSQSLLKGLAIHPSYFLNGKSFIETENLRLGNAVDFLLTQDPEEFLNYFTVKDIKTPGPQTKLGILCSEMIKHIQANQITKESLDCDELVKELYPKLDSKRKTLEEMTEEFNTSGKDYVYYQCFKDENILTPSEYERAKNITTVLKNHVFVSYILNNEYSSKQLELYFHVDGLKCKALLDIVVFDHENKVIQPYDFKLTSYSTHEWGSQILKMRYDFQAAFYSRALKENYPDYEVKPFKFIVESNKNPGSPLIYECTEAVMKLGESGGVVNGRRYKGYAECIKDLLWHMDTQIWSYSREDYLNEGVRKTSIQLSD